MFSHVFMNAFQILKESYVAELIQLVVADGLNLHIFTEVLKVCLGCGNCCDT